MSHDHELNDEELVTRAQRAGSGDLRAFETLVERHQDKVLANCRYLTRAPDEAEDLAQEVFTRAYFGLRRFRGESKFRTWLTRIKINHCINFVKKKRLRLVNMEDPGVEGRSEMSVDPVGEKSVQRGELRDQIGATLDLMSETLRVPLVLRDMDELSYQEIADQLGIGLSAAKMRIKRGREEFRRLYRELEPGGIAATHGDGGGGA